MFEGNWNWFDIIVHDLIFWCNLMIFAYLKYDKWYFIKTCGKAKFEAPPDLTITQFQGREIFLHQADHFLFTESTFFIKLKTFEGIEHLKDMKLQKMQSILLLENHFIILKWNTWNTFILTQWHRNNFVSKENGN